MPENKDHKIIFDYINKDLNNQSLDDSSSNLSKDQVKDIVDYLVLQKIKLNIQGDELQKLRQKLENTQDQFEELYNFNPISYLKLDQAGNIIDANFSAANLLGQKVENLVGESFDKYIPERFKS